MQKSVDTLSTNLSSHTSNKSNPHGVTKAQVGLGNVDNTSDANKPVSTATQTALDKKANATDLTAEVTRAKTAESNLVTLNTTQTISGAKTFKSALVVQAGQTARFYSNNTFSVGTTTFQNGFRTTSIQAPTKLNIQTYTPSTGKAIANFDFTDTLYINDHPMQFMTQYKHVTACDEINEVIHMLKTGEVVNLDVYGRVIFLLSSTKEYQDAVSAHIEYLDNNFRLIGLTPDGNGINITESDEICVVDQAELVSMTFLLVLS